MAATANPTGRLGRFVRLLLGRDDLGFAPGHVTRWIHGAGGWHQCQCGEVLTGYEEYWQHQRANGWTPPQ